MLWEQNINLCMVISVHASLHTWLFQRKSEDYYPEDIGGTITFGSYEIKVLAKKEYVDYEVRTMELVKVRADSLNRNRKVAVT